VWSTKLQSGFINLTHLDLSDNVLLEDKGLDYIVQGLKFNLVKTKKSAYHGDKIFGQKDLDIVNIPGCGLNLVDLNLHSTGITDESAKHLFGLL